MQRALKMLGKVGIGQDFHPKRNAKKDHSTCELL
jgi:hypothetical protein